MRTFDLTILTLLFLSSCGSDSTRKKAPDPTPINLEIVRTEQELFSAKNHSEVLAYLKKHPDLAKHFWHNYQYPSNQILAGQILQQILHPTVRDTVYRESVEAFENAEDFEMELEDVFGRLKTLFPDAKTPVVKTAVTVFYNDLFFSDSLVIIGLDHFIGAKSSYAPPSDYYPEYVLRRYNYEHLPSLIAFFVAGQYVSTGNSKTLLSEMIDFGKTYYLASRLVPNVPDSIVIGFTVENMIDIDANQEIVWANFIENQLLYETDHQKKKKFIDERPSVHEIGEKCPGRIGQWVGWEIVESYMTNNEVTIHELLQDRDHHKIFEKSGYKPRSE